MPEVLLNPQEQDRAFNSAKMNWRAAFVDRDLDPTDSVFQRMLQGALISAYQRKAVIQRATFAVYTQLDPKHDYAFITCGLANSLKPQEAYDRCKKFLLKPFGYLGTVVSRMEFWRAEGAYHPHVHIFVDRKIQKAKVIRDLARAFKIEPQFVDMKCRDREQHWSYINGLKQDSKQLDMEKDAETRSALGIPEVFFSQATV